MQHLRQILKVLQEKRFVANKKKCVFGDTQVEYLGHIISEKGVAVDPAKVKSVVDWPIPQSVKGVKGDVLHYFHDTHATMMIRKFYAKLVTHAPMWTLKHQVFMVM